MNIYHSSVIENLILNNIDTKAAGYSITKSLGLGRYFPFYTIHQSNFGDYSD